MIAWLLFTLLGFVLGAGVVIGLGYIQGNEIPKVRGKELSDFVLESAAGGAVGAAVMFVLSGIFLFINHLASMGGG